MDDATALDETFEIANLSEARTGIPGVVYISTRQAGHGPQVKYYEKPGHDQPSCSVSVEAAPRIVASSLPDRVTTRISGPVIEWVKLNRAALVEFWERGTYWMDEEVTAFKSSLKKLPG